MSMKTVLSVSVIFWFITVQKQAALSASTTQPATETESLLGQLLDDAGTPMLGVNVCLCDRWLDLYDAKLPEQPFQGDGLRWAKTDAEGRFSFPLPHGKYSLLVSTDTGYVLKKISEPIPSSLKLHLTPWAQLEVTVSNGGQPISPEMTIGIAYADSSFQDEMGPFLHFKAVRQSADRFVLERVFAGEYHIFRQEGNKSGAATVAQVAPGEHKQASVSAIGRTVRGRIEIPESLRGRDDVYIEPTAIERQTALPRIELPADILSQPPAGREEWFERWSSTPEGQRAQSEFDARHARRSCEIDRNNYSFGFLDMAEGRYLLPMFFWQRKADGIDYEHPPLARLEYEMNVTGSASDPALDLGTLTGKPRGYANAGQIAPDFVFATLDGQLQTLSQCAGGKVVLLDFWGTWCGGCVHDLPIIKAIHDEHKDNADFVMISLSVKDEEESLKRFIAENDMRWTQVHLGDPERAWPLQLYQVKGYPSYWVIGRDGKVIYNDWRSDDLAEVVRKAME